MEATHAVTAPAAEQIVEQYERRLPSPVRRARGVHHTPPSLARALVDVGIGALGRVPRTVLDPSCGAGAFLLAAADVLVARGVPADEVLAERLVGAELAPGAAAAAMAALREWGHAHGLADPPPLRVVVGDSLLRPAGEWRTVVPGGADLVVGNPPFLSPLAADTAPAPAARRALAARFPAPLRYVDVAALFLLVGVDAAADDGVVVMVQPRSLLAADDAGPVRAAVQARAAVHAMWTSDADWFPDAAVRVCAPVLRLGGPASSTRVLVDVPVEDRGGVVVPGPDSWGPVLATLHGVPPVVLDRAQTVRSVARATAGFRDEFYALAAATVEGVPGRPASSARRPLATVGMVDLARCDTSVRPARVAGQRFRAPEVDLDRLGRDHPATARWVRARSVPKVLLATQTRVPEAVADPDGRLVPLTPLVSVEPHDPADVWRVAAALVAPPVAASAAAQHLGSGRSAGAVRWSARRALDVPLPVAAGPWQEGAAAMVELQRGDDSGRPAALRRLAEILTVAHGLPADDPVVDWWLGQAR